jgi:hypothetical protein
MSPADPTSSSTITGTGEFEYKDSHVIATVVIREGVILSVSFGLGSNADTEIAGCTDVAGFLTGKNVSEALSVSPDLLRENFPNCWEQQTHGVLLEAFHRAVETCLDL